MVVRTRLRVTLYVHCLSFSQCPIFYVRVSWKELYKLIFDVLPFVLSNGANKILYVYITLLHWLRAGRSGIESRWGRDFLAVQTGPGTHPGSCTMGTGSFPGVKVAGAWGWHPHSHLECRGTKKSGAMPQLTLRAFVTHKKDENLPILPCCFLSTMTVRRTDTKLLIATNKKTFRPLNSFAFTEVAKIWGLFLKGRSAFE